ncbi:electron transfer flavoprotein subunit alpha/FixB family protein [Arsenicitalea aurantiaca]|uniref:Electron transfer flavoprotein subunit alpha n=1 Tax=Arsenicitalea aurantiaca TaxID=1783274 RepID=A0A433XAY6_9HYPH|nr:electron transfer flavoprotein subunit alpha/FixB family protein [Arsenicitalea aurantiaca]RUT31235.1 electron transfer flavoprotein subunit alpha/FixB family protein [Arsenicitalea aurantiaca]
MAILVVADHDRGMLAPSTARVVSAAAALGAPVDVLVAGEGAEIVARAAASLNGIARVRLADAAALRAQPAETLTPLLLRLAGDYTHIVLSAGAVGRDVAPRLAAKLGLMPVTDIIAILGPDRFERPIYAGNAIQTVHAPQPFQVLTVRASAFRPAGSAATSASVEPLEPEGLPALVRQLSEARTEGDRPDLATARIVVAGGISVGSAEGFKMIEALARALGAAVGATRAAVDAGYAPNDWQVGQTGKIVAPDLYIGIGISGALQHLAGIQGARRIIAINTDPEAPLMKLADYALVGDLFEIVPLLTARIEATQG